MATINYAAKEISVKIVYYGPGLSGKTTNLQVIHRKTPLDTRSDMVSLTTESDRTLFFDFLPLDLGKIRNFQAKFQLYTVPGQVYYNATRKLVLRGVDGIVFVADSAADKMDENIESFTNMEQNLVAYGYEKEIIPIILQYNKRDVPNALPIHELDQQLNKYQLPWSEAIAKKGKGVFETLKMIGKLVLDQLNQKYAPTPGMAPQQQGKPQYVAPQTPQQKMNDFQNSRPLFQNNAVPPTASPENFSLNQQQGYDYLGQQPTQNQSFTPPPPPQSSQVPPQQVSPRQYNAYQQFQDPPSKFNMVNPQGVQNQPPYQASPNQTFDMGQQQYSQQQGQTPPEQQTPQSLEPSRSNSGFEFQSMDSIPPIEPISSNSSSSDLGSSSNSSDIDKEIEQYYHDLNVTSDANTNDLFSSSSIGNSGSEPPLFAPAEEESKPLFPSQPVDENQPNNSASSQKDNRDDDDDDITSIFFPSPDNNK